MKKSILLGGAALLATATAAFAQGSPRDQAPANRAEVAAKVDARFAKMDANSDGVVDQADRAARMQQRFAALDTDNNGELTQAELKAGRDAMRAKRQERRAERRANRPEPTAEQKQKWAERRAARGERKGERGAKRFAALDKDGNGALSLAEFTDRPARGDRAEAAGKRGGGHHRGAMRMMKRADANRDGALSLQEMRNAALARFDKVDTDGDGTISAAEREAARDARKARRAQRQAG